MSFETIILKKEDGVATLTLNRPERLNAANRQMFMELRTALEEVSKDEGVRVLVLTGAGRAFCSGADIKDEAGGGEALLSDRSGTETLEFIREYPQKVTLALFHLNKPAIAMVNGLAMADGFDWALCCDIRIGSEKARFRNGFLQMALFPNTGGTWLYPRVMGLSKALELLYTDEWIEAEEALRLGVLNRVVPEGSLEKETMGLALRIAQAPPVAIRFMKEQVHKGLTLGLEEALDLAAFGEAFTLTTADHREAFAAFKERRMPRFKGK